MAVELTGRHYPGPDAAALPWTCPACGQTITDVAFGTGCPACGAGQPGRHVGVPPSRQPERMHAVMQKLDHERAQRAFVSPIRAGKPAFEAWCRDHYGAGVAVPTELELVLLEAFMAGAIWMQSLEAVSDPVPSPPEVPQDKGGALGPSDTVRLPRDVAERLLAILEETADLPDGQQSTELQGLIAALRETLE